MNLRPRTFALALAIALAHGAFATFFMGAFAASSSALAQGGVAPAPASPSSRAAAKQLVPANYQPKTDSLGFLWDIDAQGTINRGSNCFSNALYLELNGNGFSAQQSLMTADGSEYFLTNDLNGVHVTRRIRVDAKGAFVRFIETLRNDTGTPQSLSLSLRVQFSSQIQGVIGEAGAPVMATLGPKESGFVAVRNPAQPGPSAVFMVAGPGGKVRPSLRNENNYRVTITYPVTLAVGETVSIVHAVAQRNLAGGATHAKALARLLAPMKSARLVADIPEKERKTIGNFRGGAAAGILPGGEDMPAFVSAIETLNVEPGSTDVLAIGAETRLRGTASCTSLEIETRHGKLGVPFEKVAALAGGHREGRVFLRDGQALSGRLTAQGLKFILTTGTSMALDPARLDRLVLRATPGESGTPAGGWGYVETFVGDRLAVKLDPAFRLRANTAWGVREISPDELAGCGPTMENPLGFFITLKDGSRFVAMLDGEELAFDTLLFGRKSLRTAEIRQIAVIGPKLAPGVEVETEGEPGAGRPQVQIAGGGVITGQIDLGEVHFLSPAGVIPVAPNLMQTLQNASEEDTGETPVFVAELWGGGAVTGALREVVLPVRTGNTVFHVPVRDVVNAIVPAPAMPEGLREKIAGLIRDLGHPDWEKREAASRELGELGAMTRLQLEEAVKQTTDAEVRRRAQALLDTMEV